MSAEVRSCTGVPSIVACRSSLTRDAPGFAPDDVEEVWAAAVVANETTVNSARDQRTDIFLTAEAATRV
jgi:hypothetical protein